MRFGVDTGHRPTPHRGPRRLRHRALLTHLATCPEPGPDVKFPTPLGVGGSGDALSNRSPWRNGCDGGCAPEGSFLSGLRWARDPRAPLCSRATSRALARIGSGDMVAGVKVARSFALLLAWVTWMAPKALELIKRKIR